MFGFFFIAQSRVLFGKEAFAITKHNKNGPLTPMDVKTLVESSLDADKAFDIVSIEMDETMALSDYMVIASGTSSKHVSSLAQNLQVRLSTLGIKNVTIEGKERADWVVIDAGDIIIHLFRPEVRGFYNIEKMWGVEFHTSSPSPEQIQA